MTVEYGLDPLGRTLTRSAYGGAEESESECHYSADADTASWVADTVDEEETITRYVNGGGGMLATEIGGDIAFPLYTPHGDVWAWTDDQGDVTSTAVYDEYGNPLQPPTGILGADRYGWLGQQQRERDTHLALTIMGVRGYDPVLGRFLSVDPIRGGSANDYDYADQCPSQGSDLMGLRSCSSIRADINRMKNTVARRVRQLRQAFYEGRGIPTYGHVTALIQDQTRLQKYLIEWYKNQCGPPPPGAWQARSNNALPQAAIAALAAAAAYMGSRVVVFHGGGGLAFK